MARLVVRGATFAFVSLAFALAILGTNGMAFIVHSEACDYTFINQCWSSIAYGSNIVSGVTVTNSRVTFSAIAGVFGGAGLFRDASVSGDFDTSALVNKTAGTIYIGHFATNAIYGTGQDGVFVYWSSDGNIYSFHTTVLLGTVQDNVFNPGVVTQIYMRIGRIGNAFSYYTSTNGIAWTARGSTTQAFGSLHPVIVAERDLGVSLAGYVEQYTGLSSPPQVTTVAASSIVCNGAKLNGNLTSKGTASVVSVGFQYGKSPTLTNATNHTVSTNATVGLFNYTVTGLDQSTFYYFRAWANGTDGYAQGSILYFETSACAVVCVSDLSPPNLAIMVILGVSAILVVVLGFAIDNFIAIMVGGLVAVLVSFQSYVLTCNVAVSIVLVAFGILLLVLPVPKLLENR